MNILPISSSRRAAFRCLAVGALMLAGATMASADILYTSLIGPNGGVDKVAPDGSVSPFVSAADAGRPFAVAFDAVGNLYAADTGANTIRKITPGGSVSTFSTTGLSNPRGLTFDAAGNLYASNFAGNNVLKITPAGVSSIYVDASVGLNLPIGLVFDAAGNLYVADNGDGIIRKITPAGVVSVFYRDNSATSGLAIDRSGNVYASNFAGNYILKINPNGVGSTFATAGVNGAQNLAFDSAGFLYASNYNNDTVERFTSAGVGSVYASGSSISHPAGLAFQVPEPSTWALLGLSTLGVGTVILRRRVR